MDIEKLSKNINSFVIMKNYEKKNFLVNLDDEEKSIYLIFLYLNKNYTINQCVNIFDINEELVINFFIEVDVLDQQKEIKMCSKCFEIKPRTTEYFYKHLKLYDGLNARCISCKRNYCNKYYDKNFEKMNEQSRSYNNNNHEKILITKRKYNTIHFQEIKIKQRLYYDENKEKLLLYGKEHRKIYDPLHRDERKEYHRKRKLTHPQLYTARRARRRCKEACAIPWWVNHKDIGKIYLEAKNLERNDGIKRNVDHIHPIQHDLICGLHVPWNLQVITAFENQSKGNKFKPYTIDSNGIIEVVV